MKLNLQHILSAFAAVLMLSAPVAANAADYVDDINNNTQGYAAGQRVIYELNVGSFTQQGTLQAAQTKLQDLKALGVDVVWVMPIYTRDGGQNSPYAAVDFKAVNPKYGTIADLRNFVNAAHGLGLQVWLDWVPNHTSTKNVWVTQHPEYYTKVNGQNVHPASDGNYYRDGQTAQNAIIYTDVYQLNYNNTGLRNAMNDCLKYWIDQANIDGYRCDMVSSNGIPADYWSNAIPLIKNYKSGKTITFLGEGDFSNSGQASLRNVGFDYDYAWNFQERDLQNGFGSGSNANTLRNYSSTFYNTSRNLGVGRMVYLTNHDQNWNGDKKTLSQKYGTNKYLLTVLEFTLYGMPLIYNGEEVGGEQALNYFQDTKINWNASDSKMKNTLRTLAALKHTQAALKDGKTASDNGTVTFLVTNQQNNVLAYKRTSGKNEVLVVLNPSTSTQNVTIQNVNGTYSKWLDGATIANGTSRSNVTFNGSATITIPSKGYQVYVNENSQSQDNTGEDDGVPVINNLTDENPNSVYYESDLKDASVHVWFWSGSIGGEKYTSNGDGFPGDAMTMIGKTPEGKYIYKLSFDLNGNPMPTNLIITENGTDDANKTINGSVFVNHGYYVKGFANSTKTVTYTGGSSSDDVPVIDDLKDNTPLSIFYESDLKDASVHAWFYNGANGGEKYTSNGGGWPGDAMTMIGKTPEGKYIYKVAITLKAGVPEPAQVIITENGTGDADRPCGDAKFVNHGYYVKGVTTGSTKTVEYVTDGIAAIKVIDNSLPSDGKYYDLSGREIAKPTKGFFIHDGKKYIK